MNFSVMKCQNGRLVILDQTKLPLQESYIECRTIRMVWTALKKLQVRGAPLIGAFAGYGVYVGVKDFKGASTPKFIARAHEVIGYLKTSRPTAVNLFWALERMERFIAANRSCEVAILKQLILQEADRLNAEEVQRCRGIAEYGVTLVKEGSRILTHCNAGMLATSGMGTALAVIYEAARLYKKITVYADETRPLLQGARLTCWELMKQGIKPILICDDMAASLMYRKKIDMVIVGADRIAANGDTANKIGTYNLAVLCRHHRIPFYVAAPMNTFDLAIANGEKIPIEERSPEEVRACFGKRTAPAGVDTCNPAFDVTPHSLISAIITDNGIVYPPFRERIRKTV